MGKKVKVEAKIKKSSVRNVVRNMWHEEIGMEIQRLWRK